MHPDQIFMRIVEFAVRQRILVLFSVTIISGLGVFAVSSMERSAPVEMLVDHDSEGFRAGERARKVFGDPPIVVLVRAPLANLLLTDDLGRLLGLEGCLSGRQPPGLRAEPAQTDSPCTRLAAMQPVHAVYGPATFLNTAVGEIQQRLRLRIRRTKLNADRAARAARLLAGREGRSIAESRRLGQAAQQLSYARLAHDLLTIGLRYGLNLTHIPTLDDPQFISAVVFDPKRGASTPKTRFAALFPNDHSAVIQVRLKASISEHQRAEAIRQLAAVLKMPQWRLRHGSYSITGEPIVLRETAAALTASLLRVVLMALLAMAVTLVVVFPCRRRLVPLLVAVAAVAATYAFIGLLGLPLTLAMIAVLPILVGLTVDYAIQFQARALEVEHSVGRAALTITARSFVPTIAVAGCATIIGFLTLLLSPLPLVRQFGVVLALGVGIGLVTVLTAGSAFLSRKWTSDGRAGTGQFRALRTRVKSVRVVTDRLHGLRLALRSLSAGWLSWSLRRPRSLLGLAFLVASIGWGFELHAPVAADLRELVPQHLPALRELGILSRTTGVAGEINLIVEGREPTNPAVLSWMDRYQRKQLEDNGYAREVGCGVALLCPAFFAPNRPGKPGQSERLLASLPRYLSQAVVDKERRIVNMAFGIKMLPFAQQKALVAGMQKQLSAPQRVRAQLAGFPVVATAASTTLEGLWHRLGLLMVSLGAIGIVLALLWRSLSRVAITLAPIIFAIGWTGLCLKLAAVRLNPLSALLGTLVIAVATEFSVLLCARIHSERQGGAGLHDAISYAYGSTGRAVLASAITVTTGFVVLACSDVELLRSFGRVAVVALVISVTSVFAVLPAAFALRDSLLGNDSREDLDGFG